MSFLFGSKTSQPATATCDASTNPIPPTVPTQPAPPITIVPAIEITPPEEPVTLEQANSTFASSQCSCEDCQEADEDWEEQAEEEEEDVQETPNLPHLYQFPSLCFDTAPGMTGSVGGGSVQVYCGNCLSVLPAYLKANKDMVIAVCTECGGSENFMPVSLYKFQWNTKVKMARALAQTFY